jgi:hypothetical protein
MLDPQWLARRATRVVGDRPIDGSR